MNLNLANSISALYDSLIKNTIAEKALEVRLEVETEFSEPFYFFLFWRPDAHSLKQVFFYECLDVHEPVKYQPISMHTKCGEAVEDCLEQYAASFKQLSIGGVRVIDLQRADFINGFDISRTAVYEKTKEGKMVLQ